MDIEVKQLNAWLVIKPKGEKIDTVGGSALKSKLLDIIEQGHHRLLLNFADVENVDSSGLGTLISVGQKLLAKGGRLAFCNVFQTVLNIFNATNMSRIFAVYKDENSALKALIEEQGTQKTFAYIGTHQATFQIIRGVAFGRAFLERLDTTQDAIQNTLNNKDYAALLIETTFMTQALNRSLAATPSLKNKPLLLLVPKPSTITQQRQLGATFGISHILEYPFDESEARVLVNELIDYQPYKNNSSTLKPEEELFLEYTATLPDKLETIENLLAMLQITPSLPSVDSLEKAIHKISGSAGSYGYVKAGEICKELELFLSSILEKQQIDQKALEIITRLFDKVKFYFNTTFYKDLSRENFAIKPISHKTVYLISKDDATEQFFSKITKERGLHIEIEQNPDQAVEHLRQMNFKPELVICENHFPGFATEGIELIKAIKSSLLSTRMKFALLLEEENLDINAKVTAENINFIIKKPPSLKHTENLFDALVLDRALQPYKILVVDDDIDIGNLIKSTMGDHPVIVKILTDETKILETLYEFQPHLLLLDINLPKYNGWALLKILRTDLRYRDLKVIIITGTKLLESIKKSQEYHDTVWTKPLDKLELQQNLLGLAERYFSQSAREHRFSTLVNSKDFMKLLQAILSHPKTLFFLVLITTQDYQAILDLGSGAIEAYLIAGENIMNQMISGDCLRGYLDNGKFAFLFPEMPPEELRSLLERFCLESDYKVIVPSKSGDLFISFNACAVSFQAGHKKVEELLTNLEKTLENHLQKGCERVIIL